MDKIDNANMNPDHTELLVDKSISKQLIDAAQKWADAVAMLGHSPSDETACSADSAKQEFIEFAKALVIMHENVCFLYKRDKDWMKELDKEYFDCISEDRHSRNWDYGTIKHLRQQLFGDEK